MIGRSRPSRPFILILGYILLLQAGICGAALQLDALGSYLTRNGYGGSQLVDSGKFYHLPISSNRKAGNLVIDTGAPTTLVFRSSVKRLGLSETKTTSCISQIKPPLSPITRQSVFETATSCQMMG
jgi:hypothetical protein